MNDSGLVRRDQRLADLGSQIERLVQRQCPFIEPLPEALPLQVLLHHEVGDGAIVAGLRAHVVNDSDVGMIQRRSSPSFLLEPSQTFRVTGVLLRQHLDRHLAAQAGVLAEVHLAHAALTERFEDLVMTEGFADQDDGSLPGESADSLCGMVSEDQRRVVL